MKSQPIVFFGTEDFSNTCLEALIADGWNIALVVTKPDTVRGRGKILTEPAVKVTAKASNIPFIQPDKLSDSIYQIKSVGSKIAVLVAYGKIVPQTIIDIFPLGIINIHPSLLPKYRGPAPIENAILNGDKQTGVSLMLLNAGMDEGPVFTQQIVEIEPTATRPELYSQLAAIGSKMLVKFLPQIIDRELTPNPQNDEMATITKLLKKEDGQMDTGLPAEILEKKVRAFLGYPKSTLEINGQKIIVTKAKLTEIFDDKKLIIKCNPGLLEIEELIAQSGKKMSGEDFVRGYKRSQ